MADQGLNVYDGSGDYHVNGCSWASEQLSDYAFVLELFLTGMQHRDQDPGTK
jgi:hypothetical protein